MLVPSLVGLASAAATHCAVTAWNNEERRFREEQLSMYHRATITNTPYDAMVITSVRVDNAATAVHAAVSGLVAYRGTGRAPEHASANAPTPLLSSSTRTKQLVVHSVKEDVFVQLAVQNEPRAVETSILGSALPRSLFKQERTSRPSSRHGSLNPPGPAKGNSGAMASMSDSTPRQFVSSPPMRQLFPRAWHMGAYHCSQPHREKKN